MSWYRRSGADLPFTDPSRDHDIGMQGSYWRFVDGERVTIVLHGRCRSPSGPWSLVAIARQGRVGTGSVEWAIGDDLIDAGPDWLRVRLPADSFDATWRAEQPWAKRLWGGLGPAQAVPYLGQYWHPHLLRGSTPAGALVYAERNWGSRFADDWWWGQAFVGDATVCFAGGRQFGQAPTSLVVARGDRIIRVAPPLRRIVSATAPGRWRIRAAGLEVEAEADPAHAHVLPVPVPAERRAELRSHQHLTGRLRLTIDGELVGETELAGLERGVPADVSSDAYTVLKAADAPDYTGDAPGAFIGYARPMGSEQLGVNIRILEPGMAHVPPGEDETAGHSHDEIEEIYFVLEGELTLKLDDDTLTLGPRDAVRIAPEVVRGARNDGDANAALLMISVKMRDPQGMSHQHPGLWG